MGGGGAGLEEARYADQLGVPWLYIPSKARHQAVYGSLLGPVHEWAKQRVEQMPPDRPCVAISCLGGGH